MIKENKLDIEIIDADVESDRVSFDIFVPFVVNLAFMNCFFYFILIRIIIALKYKIF